MDLLEYNFQEAPLFRHLPPLQKLVYDGEIAPKINFYEGKLNGEDINILSAMVIRKEEKLIWQSFEELMTRMSFFTATKVKGFFEFRLLSLNLEAGVKNFQSEHLTDMLMYKSQRMVPGEEMPIQYTSLFGIFKMRIKEQWGKIVFIPSVEVYQREPYQLDLYIKKLVKESGKSKNRVILALHDLSNDPLFKAGDEKQVERLNKLFEKMLEANEILPEIYVVQKDEVVELGHHLGYRK